MRYGWLGIALGLALTAGCGSDEKPQTDREQIEAAATGYLKAAADGDGAEACRRLTAGAQKNLATTADADTCEEAIERFKDALPDEARDDMRNARVSKVTIDGTTAQVTIAGGNTETVEKSDDGWRVALFTGEVEFRSKAEGECITGGMTQFDDGGGDPFWQSEGRADFRDFIVATCRQADAKGLLNGAEPGPEFEKIAGRVILRMVRSGQIRDPR